MMKIPDDYRQYFELLAEAIAADSHFLDNPTVENQELAELAASKAEIGEIRAIISNDSGEYSHIPQSLRQHIVSNCNRYLQSPTETQKLYIDSLWDVLIEHWAQISLRTQRSLVKLSVWLTDLEIKQRNNYDINLDQIISMGYTYLSYPTTLNWGYLYNLMRQELYSIITSTYMDEMPAEINPLLGLAKLLWENRPQELYTTLLSDFDRSISIGTTKPVRSLNYDPLIMFRRAILAVIIEHSNYPTSENTQYANALLQLLKDFVEHSPKIRSAMYDRLDDDWLSILIQLILDEISIKTRSQSVTIDDIERRLNSEVKAAYWDE